MTRHTKKVPSYRHHKATGQAVVTLNGKDVYLGNHGAEASHDMYRQVIAEWLANHQQPPASSSTGALPESDLIDVNQLFVAYWKYAQTYYVKDGRPSRELSNIKDAARPLIELFGSAWVKDFRPSSLKAVRQAMVDADLSRKTINNRINRIRRIFKWGVENDLVSASVLHALQAVSPLRKGRCGVKEGAGVKPVPEETINAVMPCLPPTLQAMIRIQQYTGMRPGELVIMRTRDLDTAGKTWIYRPESHKTEHLDHDRIIYIGERAQGYLRPYLNGTLDAFVFSPKIAMAERWEAKSTHRKKTNTERKTNRKLKPRYTPSAYLQAIYYACDQASPAPEPLCRMTNADGKLESLGEWKQRLTEEQMLQLKKWQKEHHWHPHQLRHNAATSLRREFGVEAARVVLGHRSAAATEIYAEVDKMKAAEVMTKVG